jgi:hypothetical protein
VAQPASLTHVVNLGVASVAALPPAFSAKQRLHAWRARGVGGTLVTNVTICGSYTNLHGSGAYNDPDWAAQP